MDTHLPSPQQQKISLLLSGGGARGAYQVGVLKAIAQLYPRNHGIPFPILCGTSAGAINTTALGCYASCFHLGVKKLEWVWRNMSTDKIYRCDFRGVSSHLLKRLTRNMLSQLARNQPVSLFDNQPLRELLNSILPFHRLETNVSRGYLHAVAVTASCYNSGDSVTFYQGHPDISSWQRAKRLSQQSVIHSEHLLASSALPLIFPAIEICQEFYGDGSIHQLAPLSPPIHLGANKILIIGLDSPHDRAYTSIPHHPEAATITGHLLDTIFSDTLYADLERLSRINTTLEKLPSSAQDSLGLTPIDTLLIKPSIDLNQLAAEHFHQMPPMIKLLLQLIGINAGSDTSLISYLLFEKEFCIELIDAGYQDAMAHEAELRAFFNLDK